MQAGESTTALIRASTTFHAGEGMWMELAKKSFD